MSQAGSQSRVGGSHGVAVPEPAANGDQNLVEWVQRARAAAAAHADPGDLRETFRTLFDDDIRELVLTTMQDLLASWPGDASPVAEQAPFVPDPIPLQAKADVVGSAESLLGSRLAAYVAGTDSGARLASWRSGEEPVPTDAYVRLSGALAVASWLASHDVHHDVIQVWFQGMEPGLGDRSPARVLRDDASPEAKNRVLAAARSFLWR